MIQNKYQRYRCITKALYVSIVTLGLFPISASCQLITVFIHNQNDKQAIAALTQVLVSAGIFSASMLDIKNESDNTQNIAREIVVGLNEFDRNIKEYYTEMDKWQKLTKPNLAYPRLIEKLNKDLIDEDALINSKLTLLKQNLFSNSAILLNTASEYSQNNPIYSAAIIKQSMCPNPATTLIRTPNNNSYGKLHQDSCLLIYNLRAYKKLLNTEVRKKHDLIDKTTENIFKLPDITMGDHNARKDALMSVQILREKMMYEHRVNMEEMDTRINIADRTRIYSGAAMVGGAPTNPGLTATTAVAKTILGGLFTASNIAPKTPYNQ